MIFNAPSFVSYILSLPNLVAFVFRLIRFLYGITTETDVWLLLISLEFIRSSLYPPRYTGKETFHLCAYHTEMGSLVNFLVHNDNILIIDNTYIILFMR